MSLLGYEWTSDWRSCFWVRSHAPRFDHKIVILPLAVGAICPICETPDALAAWAADRGGIVITPHPWRVKLLDGSGLELRHDYFLYTADGPRGVMAGVEVGPDFPVLSWPSRCEAPGESSPSRTTTLDEWRDALTAGKHLAAVASSDRHFGFTPFGLRTTIVFTTGRTEAAVLEALRARRTMACNLAPFPVRFSVDGQVVGSRVQSPREALIEIAPSAVGEIESTELWLGGRLLKRWLSLPTAGVIRFPIDAWHRGALWVTVLGSEIDPATGTRRATITSPITLRD